MPKIFITGSNQFFSGTNPINIYILKCKPIICSVEDLGCLYRTVSRIRIFLVWIPDPGSKRHRLPDPQQIIYVFFTQNIQLNSWKYNPGCLFLIPDPRSPRREVVFVYEYLREFEAKIGTARSVV
jgi:hypothetical protein